MKFCMQYTGWTIKTSRTLALNYKTPTEVGLNQTKYIFLVSKHLLICIQKSKLIFLTLTEILSKVVRNDNVCMYVCGFISRNPYSLSSHEARP